jgi:hypothetical protein
MGKPNAHPGSCRGRYHTDRQRGAASVEFTPLPHAAMWRVDEEENSQ